MILFMKGFSLYLKSKLNLCKAQLAPSRFQGKSPVCGKDRRMNKLQKGGEIQQQIQKLRLLLIPGNCLKPFKVMFHGTIRNDDFWRYTALQCWNNVATIPINVVTMLQRCVALKIAVANRLV